MTTRLVLNLNQIGRNLGRNFEEKIIQNSAGDFVSQMRRHANTSVEFERERERERERDAEGGVGFEVVATENLNKAWFMNVTRRLGEWGTEVSHTYTLTA